jgi:hypothetical protein
MMSPLVAPDAVDEIGRHFVQWVISRGVASALRVGRVPYGVLPVTSLTLWQHREDATPVEQRMVGLLQQGRSFWSGPVPEAPHVGRSSDPDQDLLDVLAMDASARQARVRRVVGDAVYLNLAQLNNWPIAQWENQHQAIGSFALGTLGVDVSQNPPVIGLNFSDQSRLYDGPLVDIAPLSEAQKLSHDYISWVKDATIAQLRLESLPANWSGDLKSVLLYRFLRHGALSEYHRWAGMLLTKYPMAREAPVETTWQEPEMVGIVPGTESRQTPWQRFHNQVDLPNPGVIDIETFLDGDAEELRALTGVGDYRDALAVLAPLPTAELERLFTESHDAVTHRIDEWIT